jgi:hypothetical protein
MFENAIATYRDRRVTYAFDGPVLEPEACDGVEVWHERVKVSCDHDRDRKAYVARVSWCKAAERNGYTMEQTAIFTDPLVEIFRAPAARFSEKSFDAFCANVQALCVAIEAEPELHGVAGELLRKARSFGLVKN